MSAQAARRRAARRANPFHNANGVVVPAPARHLLTEEQTGLLRAASLGGLERRVWAADGKVQSWLVGAAPGGDHSRDVTPDVAALVAVELLSVGEPLGHGPLQAAANLWRPTAAGETALRAGWHR